MRAGLPTGMVQSPHIRVFLLESVTTYNSHRSSSWMAPMGNGTAEHRNAGITLDHGHRSFPAKPVPAMRTTQRSHHSLMLRLSHSPTTPLQLIITLLPIHPSLSFRLSSSRSTSSNRSVMQKSLCLEQQEAVRLSCGSGAICTLSLMVKRTKNG